MAHRVQQILDAVAAALRANLSLRAHVDVHRVLSLSEADDELPALTVNCGADTPDDSAHLDDFGSSLDVVLTAYCTGDSQTEVLEQLLELRRQSHIAMRTDMTFGLSFVWENSYGGAEPPLIQKADRIVGALTSRWAVRYLMNQSDPG